SSRASSTPSTQARTSASSSACPAPGDPPARSASSSPYRPKTATPGTSRRSSTSADGRPVTIATSAYVSARAASSSAAPAAAEASCGRETISDRVPSKSRKTPADAGELRMGSSSFTCVAGRGGGRGRRPLRYLVLPDQHRQVDRLVEQVLRRLDGRIGEVVL